MPLAVRPAQREDADRMGALHVRAWQRGYAHVMPAAYLAALDPAQRAEMWRNLIGDGRGLILVSVDDDGVVRGFAAAGTERDEGRGGELYALNVDPPAWGGGHGRALLATATEWLGARWTDAVLWVVADNPRALGLYAGEGWRADGGRRSEALLGAVVDEIRLHRPLR